MPRASRYWLPGHVWHLTHRRHRRQFFLRFGHDPRLWVKWLHGERVRHGLRVLDYVITRYDATMVESGEHLGRCVV